MSSSGPATLRAGPEVTSAYPSCRRHPHTDLTGVVMVAETELERIEKWREKCLLEAGYPSEEARLIAICRDIDLHYAIDLIVVKGCDPVEASRILL